MLKAFKPAASHCSLTAQSGHGPSGAVSKRLIKMSLGLSSGLAIVPNGLCRIIGHSPQSIIASMSPSRLCREAVSRCQAFCSSVFSITTASMALRSPRLISFTVPHTGDVSRILGLFLSLTTVCPTSTRSPSCTSSLGVSPTKSDGWIP